jgi:hypothetical protein
MKAIVFDSGTIINFAINGMTEILRELKEKFDGKFFITEDVKYEIMDRPLKIKRFELESMMIRKLFDDKVIELPNSVVDRKQLEEKTNELNDKLNHTFFARGEFVKIMDKGELSAMALCLLLDEKGIKNVLAVDERTTRVLCEMPQNLQKILQDKLHTKVETKRENLSLTNIKVIRSSELMYVAYKKGLVKLKDGNVLEALLYAVKFHGCSISFDEIDQMKNL